MPEDCPELVPRWPVITCDIAGNAIVTLPMSITPIIMFRKVVIIFNC